MGVFSQAQKNMKNAKQFDREELSKMFDFVNKKLEENKNE